MHSLMSGPVILAIRNRVEGPSPGAPSQSPPWAGPPGGPPWTWPGRPWRGMRWRVSATILFITAWLAFILLYAAFWAGGFTLFQSIMIGFVSIIVLGGSIAALWAAWGMRFAGGGWDRHWR